MEKTFLLAVALLGLSANAAAQATSSTMNVEIESRAITLVNTGELNFGKLLPYGIAGSLSVATNGVGTGTNVFLTDATNVRASTWVVSGIPGASFFVTLPTSVAISNGTNSMTVTGFYRSGAIQLVLDTAGNRDFAVGARLNVGANQASGVYTGTFNVTASYN
jgi:Mat/Ecp fimbriae major subunit